MKAAGLKLHISRMNRRGRFFSQLHSQQIHSLFAKQQVFQITGGAGLEATSPSQEEHYSLTFQELFKLINQTNVHVFGLGLEENQ